MVKSYKKIVSVFFIVIMCALGGCKDSDKYPQDNSSEQNVENDGNIDNNDDNEDEKLSEEEKEANEIYESLFSMDSKVKIDIDITDEELAKIQADYNKYGRGKGKSPIYRICNLKITINDKEYEIPEVGIRMKGNTSRNSFYNDKEGAYNLIHCKLSFDETFEDENYYGEDAKVWDDEDEKKERKKRTFATLKGMELKWNREVDSTYIRETYAFKMYRDFGLLAPNNSLGQLCVNNESWGVYKFYEPVDKKFIGRYFDEEDQGGDLYKCSWSSGPADYTTFYGKAGVNDDDSGKRYTYDLKTNKKTSTHESLQKFINTIQKDNLTKDDVEKLVDVDNYVKFMAVSYFLGMPDDMRNNYNNHYVYFKPSGQAVFIAYDCDLSLGICQWNPLGNYMTETNPYSEHAYGNGGDQNNKLIVKTISKTGILADEYTKVLEEVATSKWMTFDNFKSMYEIIEDKYSDTVVPAKQFKNLTSAQKSMSIDDTYVENGETKNNHNLCVEQYFQRILENYEKRKNG